MDDPGTDHLRRRQLGTRGGRRQPVPRHWIYDHHGPLVQKSGLVDFKDWYQRAFGKHTPWGDEDSPALVTEVETALERELSGSIMRGG